MLYKLALDYYYINLKANLFSVFFEKLCKSTYNYFKGPEYRRNILTQ
jgi:hypothetical protein